MGRAAGTVVRVCLASVTAVALTGLGLAAPAAAGPRTCFGEPATIVGTDAKNIINGTSHADVIVALDGDDIIHGNGGDDLICAGEGADHVYGDAGNDAIRGGLGSIVTPGGDGIVENDLIFGGPGNDFIDPGFDDRDPTFELLPDIVDYRDATAGIGVEGATGTIDASVGGQGVDQVVLDHVGVRGTPYPDQMKGGPEDDWFNGLGGADVLTGGLGDDQLFDDSNQSTAVDADSLSGGGGADTLIAHGGSDTLAGGDGNDLILDQGETSADRISGGGGDDRIEDFLSRDTGQSIDGGAGRDTAHENGHSLGESPVALDLAAGALTIGQGAGAVSLPFTNVEHAIPDIGGYLTVTGTDGDDELDGSQAGMGARLIGLAGDDSLWGSYTDDYLDGGPGFDTADYSGGHDTCLAIEVLYRGGTCVVRQPRDRHLAREQAQ